MTNLVLIMVHFCFLNAITILSYVTNTSLQSNGPYSPPYNPSGTKAILTWNYFGPKGESGKSKCDIQFHPLPERVVALSTGWYNNRQKCGKMIKITAQNERTATAKVVDECDSVNGQPPCKDNIVDVSKTIWYDLGLNTADGEVPVTWAMV
ncbi:hypothetical protein HN51_055680 [Arachis hypogaea]|uniref:ripening-related protein grip22-like n=1 Tax=Arachis ipaensis TaxID=130454 RepID=UPI0007AF8336|nr:ripening-related protein grip22-like [Arachis ipaensis]XP_025678863.1 ripening-related protein grip22-like [Arachis hypogaea]